MTRQIINCASENNAKLFDRDFNTRMTKVQGLWKKFTISKQQYNYCWWYPVVFCSLSDIVSGWHLRICPSCDILISCTITHVISPVINIVQERQHNTNFISSGDKCQQYVCMFWCVHCYYKRKNPCRGVRGKKRRWGSNIPTRLQRLF